jgi:hypothetical protein
MTETSFEGHLRSLLDDEGDLVDCFGPDAIRQVETFEDAGILTNNRGLVVTMVDGSELQLTIVCSRPGRRRNEEDEA